MTCSMTRKEKEDVDDGQSRRRRSEEEAKNEVGQATVNRVRMREDRKRKS